MPLHHVGLIIVQVFFKERITRSMFALDESSQSFSFDPVRPSLSRFHSRFFVSFFLYIFFTLSYLSRFVCLILGSFPLSTAQLMLVSSSSTVNETG